MNNLSTSVYENKEVYALSKRLSLEKKQASFHSDIYQRLSKNFKKYFLYM